MADGLILRDFQVSDLFTVTLLSEDPDVAYFDGNRVAGGWYQSEGGAEQLTWVPELRADGQAQPCGIVTCHLVNAEPLVYSVGIDLVAEYRGLGLGKLVMRQVLRRLFREFEAERVELLVRDYNLRAIRCYEAVGFKHEGLRRDCGLIAGRTYGEMLMGILRSEYLGREAGGH